MESFIESLVLSYDANKSKVLLGLLHSPNIEFRMSINKSSSRRLKTNNHTGEKKLGTTATKRVNKIGALKRKILNSSNNTENKLTKRVRSMPKSKSNEYLHNDELNSTLSISAVSRRDEFFVFDYSIDLIASQLTLIEWVCKFYNFRQPIMILIGRFNTFRTTFSIFMFATV
jgi:hypothetical protein